MENQAIAGIYDLLDIVLEKLDRIERNQDKERISRVFASAYNDAPFQQSDLSHVKSGQPSRNNFQRNLSSRPSLLSIPSLAQDPTPEPFTNNVSSDITSMTVSNASEPTESAFSSNPENNDVQNQTGSNYLENENNDIAQKKDRLSLDQEVEQSPILGRNEKRKLLQQEHEEKGEQKLKKNRQDDRDGYDDENQSFQNILFAEEFLSDEGKITNQELPLERQIQQDIRIQKEKKDEDQIQQREVSAIPNDSNLQTIQQVPKEKAIRHGQDNLLDDEIALNNTAKLCQKGKTATVNKAKTKRKRELILTRHRRNMIMENAATKNKKFNLTISQSDFEGSNEIDQLISVIKYKLRIYNKGVTDKRRKCTNIEQKSNSIYNYLAMVTSQILKNRQHIIQSHSWSNISKDVQEEILNEIEYEVQKKYENFDIAFNDCIDRWPTRIIIKYVYPTYMSRKPLQHIPIPTGGNDTLQYKHQINHKGIRTMVPENRSKTERRKPVVEPNLDDDDDDTIAD